MKKWLPWIVFALFGFFLLKPNFTAELGMIDDHEIPLFLGSDGKIELWEIPRVIISTEVGEYGTSLRYRPAYFALRVFETALWRDNATLWYASRYLITVISMVILYLVVRIFFPEIVAYLTVLYAYTLPFWADILTRLGPSEIYAVLGSLLFTLGAIKQLKNEGGLWQLILGYVICVGAKENFLILLPILLIIILRRTWTKMLTKREAITYGLAILFTIFIAGGILLATTKSGTDVYGGQISYTERIARLYQYKRYIFDTRYMHFSAIVLVIAIWQYIRKRVGLSHITTMITILVVISSQYIFYNSTLPTHMRYDFPGMLLFPALNLVALHYLLSFLPTTALGRIVKWGGYYCLFVYLLFIIFTRGYGHVTERGISNSNLTAGFATKLELVTRRLKSYPDYPLVMTSDYYLDFEPIVALQRFLVAKSISNPLMLDYHEHDLETGNLLMAELLPRLYEVEKMGNSEIIFGSFVPLEIPSDGKCFSVSFGKELPSQCEHLVSF